MCNKTAVLLQQLFFFLWTLPFSHLCPPGFLPGICLSVSLMCQMFWISPRLLSASRMNRPRWTGREGDGVLGESTAVRNPMPRSALMPDALCVSHFVRSLAELRACVWGYPFPSSPTFATWPGLKATQACAFWPVRAHQGVIGNNKRQPIWRLIGAYKETKGRGALQTERKKASGASLDVSLVSLSPGWNAELLIQKAVW